MSWKTTEDQIEKGPGSTLMVAFIWIMAIGLMLGLVQVIFKPFNLVGKVFDNDKIINNYEYFHQQSQDITIMSGKIQLAKKSSMRYLEMAGDHKDWTYEDKTEYSRLSSLVDGLQYQCNDMVSQYNARSKMITREMFKSDALPYQMSTEKCQ